MLYRYVLYCLLSVLCFITRTHEVSGQSITRKIADKKFARESYVEAIALYRIVLAKDSSEYDAMLRLAECYRAIKDSYHALPLYARLVSQTPSNPDYLWAYAQTLAQEQRYPQAAQAYAQYAALRPEDLQGKRFRDAYLHMDVFYRDSAATMLHYLPTLNSWQADFSPVFYGNGLLFCSGRTKDEVVRKVFDYDQTSLLDWYIVTDTTDLTADRRNAPTAAYTVDVALDRNDDFSGSSSNDTPIAGHYGHTFLFDSVRYEGPRQITIEQMDHPFTNKHVGPACFFVDQKTMILSSNEWSKADRRYYLNLYSAELQDHQLTNITRLPFNSDHYSISHPNFSPDYRRLYFSSDNPAGAGGTDIYYVDYNDGLWGEPVNVAAVNTPGNECFPYLDPEGHLYFSSDGHPGLGGLDVFCAYLQTGDVFSLKNLGAPINSCKDDFGIIFSGPGEGYVSSNRKRGLSDDDIYYFHQSCQPVQLYVYHSTTGKPVAGVKITASQQAQYTNDEGETWLCMGDGYHTYALAKDGFNHMETTSNESRVEVSLAPLAFDLAGEVSSDATGNAISQVHLELINLSDHSTEYLSTSHDGTFSFPLAPGQRYHLVASKEHCGTKSIELTTAGLYTSQTLTTHLKLLCIGDVVKIENIYYDLNKAKIRTDATPELDKLADMMYQYPDMRIELRSHTDSRADKSSNLKLSALRAQAVVDYLMSKGIVPYRMRAVGYGESAPINQCIDDVPCTEEEHQQNRHTEFKVLDIGTLMYQGKRQEN